MIRFVGMVDDDGKVNEQYRVKLPLDVKQMLSLYTELLSHRDLSTSRYFIFWGDRGEDPEELRIKEIGRVCYILELLARQIQNSRTDERHDCTIRILKERIRQLKRQLKEHLPS